MSAAEWGIIATATVALASFAASYLTSSTLARRERLFRVRSETYREVLTKLHLRIHAMDRHHPLLGPHEPWPPQSREEMARIDASIGVFGSEDVREAVATFGDIVFEFRVEAGHYEGLQGSKAAAEIQFERLQELRKRARTKLLEIERAMQRELGE